MKKKLSFLVIVVLIIILVVSTFIAKKVQENYKLEVLQILKENGKIQVYIHNDDTNLNEIEKELTKINNVESVEFVSRENVLQEMKEKFPSQSNILDNYNIFPNSFILTIKIDNVNDIKEEYFKSIEDNINNIDGIRKISNGYYTLIKEYNQKGIYKLRKAVEILNNLEN